MAARSFQWWSLGIVVSASVTLCLLQSSVLSFRALVDTIDTNPPADPAGQPSGTAFGHATMLRSVACFHAISLAAAAAVAAQSMYDATIFDGAHTVVKRRQCPDYLLIGLMRATLRMTMTTKMKKMRRKMRRRKTQGALLVSVSTLPILSTLTLLISSARQAKEVRA